MARGDRGGDARGGMRPVRWRGGTSTRRRTMARSATPRTTRRARATSPRARRTTAARATGALAERARARLRGFRRASVLVVALTALLLLLFEPRGSGQAQGGGAATQGAVQEEVPDTVSIIRDIPTEELQRPAAATEEEVRADTLARAAARDAQRTLRGLWVGFVGNLPKYLIALAILGAAWAVVRIFRPLLRRLLGGWERSSASVALFGVVVWTVAFGIALSVLVGDIRALVGSLGLVGLALSWALQTPIESFTGWLLNSFQGYYRVGDRVAVGDVFGDVYEIDFLTTTVWEAGSPDQPGPIDAEQPTGRLITFPNNEVLRGSIVNLTRDFPYVWDELDIGIANEADLEYAIRLLDGIARDVIGEQMVEPARQYEQILQRAGLESAVATEPQIFVSLTDAWINVTLRYLVGARERRKWKSLLVRRITEALREPENQRRVPGALPRQQVQVIGADGRPREVALEGDAGT